MMVPLETEIIGAAQIANRYQRVEALRRARQAELAPQSSAWPAVHPSVLERMAVIARRLTLGLLVPHDGHARG